MGPESKTTINTCSRHIGEVDAVVKFEPKKMVKEEMKGGNREQGKGKKSNKGYNMWQQLKKIRIIMF